MMYFYNFNFKKINNKELNIRNLKYKKLKSTHKDSLSNFFLKLWF